MIKRTIAICGLSLALLSNLNAAPAKTYHVTGPILELTDKTIVVQKGDERWEIARDENTKSKGQLKVGQFADFIILSDDLTKIPPPAYLKAKVLRTVVGGRTVYQ